MDIVYCIIMGFISLKVRLRAFARIFNIFFRVFTEDKCLVALVLVVMTIKGFTFHPLFKRLLISG